MKNFIYIVLRCCIYTKLLPRFVEASYNVGKAHMISHHRVSCCNMYIGGRRATYYMYRRIASHK